MPRTLTAPERLARLEQDAIDGKPVTAQQLAEAREAVALADLQQVGKDARAEQARLEKLEEARADAKARAVTMLEDLNDATVQAREAVAAAVDQLIRAVDERNAVVQQVRELFDSVELVTRDGADPEREDFDPKFHVHTFNSNVSGRYGVVVNGEQLTMLVRSLEVEAAVSAGQVAAGRASKTRHQMARARRR